MDLLVKAKFSLKSNRWLGLMSSWTEVKDLGYAYSTVEIFRLSSLQHPLPTPYPLLSTPPYLQVLLKVLIIKLGYHFFNIGCSVFIHNQDAVLRGDNCNVV